MAGEKTTYDLGVIHGRFQVLHNDHLTYLLAGKSLCRHLVVGVTNPDPRLTGDDPSDPQRSSPEANPLTYYERQFMLREALQESGVDSKDFSIVPLPINFPELYKYYVPLDAVFFLTIYDEWGKKKLEYFQDLGLQTHILWEVPPEQKGLSGQEVRRLLRVNGDWESCVPGSVAGLIKAWRIRDRLGYTDPTKLLRK
ncbi:MAG: nicotinate-nucleotide adenylyltransferase [Desulfohalobiaceae bacterium]|nr:nicotinate-nucleotide adenylyltransferase [Desulfohalobiaceae bacterium]